MKRLFLLDMDGTIYLDEALFPGTRPFLEAVRAAGGRYLFLTNNSSNPQTRILPSWPGWGSLRREDFLTSVDALIAHLAARQPRYHKCYVFGTASFRSQLAGAGVAVTDRLEEDVDCLLVGFDTELTFQKLEDACILLGRGVDFIATNPDWVCPTWYALCPTAAACAKCSSGPPGGGPGHRKAGAVHGPSGPGADRLCTGPGGDGGDRLYTDIAAGSTPVLTRPSSSPARGRGGLGGQPGEARLGL